MSSMKRSLFLIFALCVTEVATAQIETPEETVDLSKAIRSDKALKVPAATIASVQKATQIFGDNALKGNFSYAIEKMYPRYRKKQQKVLGKGIDPEAIEKETASRLNAMGVTITSYTAGRPIGVFKVWQQIKPSMKLKIDQGINVKLKKSDVFHNWMFIVPTTQVWTFTSQRGGPPRKAKIEGFQIVIAQESTPGQEQWTFIEGSGMTTRELRTVFPSLPVQLLLPTIKKSEIK